MFVMYTTVPFVLFQQWPFHRGVCVCVFRCMFVLQSFELCVWSWAFDPKEAVNNTTLHDVFIESRIWGGGGYHFTIHNHNSNDFR